ncbi:hypothetical protein JTB14_031594 [Gonioctena quinquepunctata]|nr:hypothetical protein JTB14_031594 [Gonioctena quinquepunctata]
MSSNIYRKDNEKQRKMKTTIKSRQASPLPEKDLTMKISDDDKQNKSHKQYPNPATSNEHICSNINQTMINETTKSTSKQDQDNVEPEDANISNPLVNKNIIYICGDNYAVDFPDVLNKVVGDQYNINYKIIPN